MLCCFIKVFVVVESLEQREQQLQTTTLKHSWATHSQLTLTLHCVCLLTLFSLSLSLSLCLSLSMSLSPCLSLSVSLCVSLYVSLSMSLSLSPSLSLCLSLSLSVSLCLSLCLSLSLSLSPGSDGPVQNQKSVDSFSFLHHPVHQRSLEILQRCKDDKYSKMTKITRFSRSTVIQNSVY